VSIRLRQLQAGARFRLRLPIEVTDRGGRASRDTLMVSERDSTYRLDTAARPLLVRLDPDRTLLLWRPEYGPRPDSTTASGPSRSGTAEHAP
jgi:hypothetical protein